MAGLAGDPWVPILLVLLIAALLRTIFLSARISRLTQGGDGKSLEGTIRGLTERVTLLEGHAKTSEVALNNLDERVGRAVRGVSVKRYDPFENSGGQQSFTSALVDEHGDGVLISGIHARDSVRVYAKEIKNFSSDRELSSDERTALDTAKEKLK